MTTPEATAGSRAKLAQVERAWSDLLAQALRRGFFGSVSLELQVQDGTIQSVRRKVEKVEK
ncbi:MAG: hypothetical protein AB7O62_25350 [Pirellulales bacterium]